MSADPETPSTARGSARSTRSLALWVPALLMVVIVGALWGPNLLRPPPPAWTVYTSVKGATRRVVLADKSVMRLNGASQVRLVYQDDWRDIALGQAEMALTAAPSHSRPFRIASGDRVIELDGGEVNVLRQTGQNRSRTVLTLRQGRARIYSEDRPREVQNAVAGQEVSWIDGQDALPAVRAVNAANAFAWENHQLAYDRAPLSSVVDDLNRYVARPIRIPDPAVAALPFTGVLTLEGEDVMLRKIATALPVQSRPAGAEILMERAAAERSTPSRRRGRLVQSLLKLDPRPGKGAPSGARSPDPDGARSASSLGEAREAEGSGR